jgi:hypothetical protein
MISWFIPNEFCCGLVCAGLFGNLDTSSLIKAKIVYVVISILMGFSCLLVKIFEEKLYENFEFLMVNCSEGTRFSTHIIHAFMMSLAVFHLFCLCVAGIKEPFGRDCYQKCWLVKFITYFILLVSCVWVTSAFVKLI